ncbi:hypothetical protein KUH75_004138 [Salmonella enterica]|nr:hypothetical protein [Salmonella enterica]EHR6310868.1 hypothetical protein [Salmonella enterica]
MTNLSNKSGRANMNVKRPSSFTLAAICTVGAIISGSLITALVYSLGVQFNITTIYIYVAPILTALVAVNLALTPNEKNEQLKCVLP